MSASAADRRRTRVPAELSRYLAALFGPTPGALLDIRVRRGGAAMTQHFAPARGGLAGSLIVELGAGADVYLGVLPRRREHGGKDGLMRHGWTLWAYCDTPQATAALEAFAPSPSLIVASGSPGHRHAYWLLRRPLELADVERANRRLAAALSADGGAVTNAATILRPPSTHNFKGDELRPVRLLDAASLRQYRAAQIVGTLPDLQSPGGQGSGRGTPRPTDGDPLLEIAPRDYFRVLVGREPNRAGKLRCPLHPDHTPSLRRPLPKDQQMGQFSGSALARGRK
ncbi:MAG: hypothetical protein ACJ76T_19930 [Solirubrobacteraceae bacterium]